MFSTCALACIERAVVFLRRSHLCHPRYRLLSGTPLPALRPAEHTTPDEPPQIVLETPRPPRLLSHCVPGMLSPPRDNRRTSSRPQARPVSPPKIPDRSPYPDEDEGVGLNQFVAQGVSKLRDAFGFRSAGGGSASSGASATVGGTAGGVAGSSGPPTRGEQGSDQRAVEEDLPRMSAEARLYARLLVVG